MAILLPRIVSQIVHRDLRSRQASGINPNTDSSSGGMTGGQTAFIVAAAIIIVVIAIVAYWFVTRYRKRQTTPSSDKPKSIFSRFRSGSNRGQYSAQLQPSDSSQTVSGNALSQTPSRESRQRDVEMGLVTDERSTSTRNNNTENPSNNESGVDRHTSVRSIMTLPPYSVAARPTEQVLGREGERAGIDLVIEQPETQDEVEERREEEMESLFQIRQARRQEAADREERRRQRREARQRGDNEALSRLAQESRQRAQLQTDGLTMSAQLIAEHQTRPRERRVSSVQYQDVGVARHDGTRVRNTSIDSDNRPLLSSAASIAGGSSSTPSSYRVHQHGRDRSTTSFQSISSMESGSSAETAMVGSRSTNNFEVITLDSGRTTSNTSTSPNPPEAATGATPVEPPPNYDEEQWGEAPPYESPVTTSNPQFPPTSSTHTIPSIRVSPTTSPVVAPR